MHPVNHVIYAGESMAFTELILLINIVTHRFPSELAEEVVALMASGKCGKVAVCADEELKHTVYGNTQVDGCADIRSFRDVG